MELDDAGVFICYLSTNSYSYQVILDCHAEWCGPCKQLAPLLARAVESAGGKVRLATLDVDTEKALATKLSVQSLPTVFGVYKGKLVDSFVGMKSDADVKAFIDKLVQTAESDSSATSDQQEPPPKNLMAEAAEALASGDVEGAMVMYKEVYSALRATVSGSPDGAKQTRESKDEALLQQATCLIGLASCAMASGDADAAEELLTLVKKEHPFEVGNNSALAKAVAQLELAVKEKTRAGLEGSGSIATLEAKLSERLQEEGEAAEAALSLRLDLAHAFFAQSRFDEALDQALLVVKADAQWHEAAGKALCLQFFDALGSDHPSVKKGRRRLGNLLFV